MRVNQIIKAENIWQQQIDKKFLFDGEKAQSYSMNSNTIVQVNEIEKQTSKNHKEKTDQRNKKPTPKPHPTVKEKKNRKRKKNTDHMAYNYLFSIKMSTGWDTPVASLIQFI